MIIMKFGGTSVGNAERINNIAKIVVDHFHKKGKVVMVVSAMNGVTDKLLTCAKMAVNKDRVELDRNFSMLYGLHNKTVNELGLDNDEKEKLLVVVESYFKELRKILDSMFFIGEATDRGLDLIASFGERLSIHLVTQAIKKLGVDACAIEATNLIVTDDHFADANPLLEESTKKVKAILPSLLNRNIIPVITGFIGATKNSDITTLGRGGSDYSATILGYCLDAKQVWIWKDVDGVMTADPKIVKDAKTLRRISYNEAAELSYFGAKVLHPRTLVPAASKKIPVWIKNSFDPTVRGTEIAYDMEGNGHGVKAITSIKGLSLVTLQGKGMMGVPGTAAKLFVALAEEGINVMFISQASSEHNISFIVRKQEGSKTREILKEAFQLELLHKRIENIIVEDDVAIIAVVGEGMKGKPGISGKTFSALGAKKVNIMAIAQGSSELNISMVIREQDLIQAVRSIHKAFHLGD